MISTKTFTGEFPRVLPYLAPTNAAQYALDCDFALGSLAGIRDRSPVYGVGTAGVKSLYVHDSAAQNAYYWTRDVVALRGPIANDKYSRFYWLDAGQLYVSRGDVGSGEPTGTNKYKVGVPTPTAPHQSAAAQTFPLNMYGSEVTVCYEGSDGTTGPEKSYSVTLRKNDNKELAWTIVGYTEPVKPTPAATTSSASESSGVCSGIGITNPDTGEVALWTFSPELNYTIASSNSVLFAGHGLIYAYGADGTSTTLVGPTVANVASLLINGQWVTLASMLAVQSTTAVVTYSILMKVKHPTLGHFLLRPYGGAKGSTMPAGLSGYNGGTAWDGSLLAASIFVTSTAVLEHRAYVCTYVNQFGEEGPASDPFEIDVPTNAEVKLNLPVPSATGYCPISSIRLYRTATGSSATDYLYVNEFTPGSSELLITDAVANASLGEPLSTKDFYPPEAGLTNIIALPNGIFMASKGNELYFSEPYLPYAWRPRNAMTTLNAVVGMCAAEGGAYVTTNSNPYFISGMTPDAMSQSKITSIQAGASKRGICNIGMAVVYASHDGLCMARGVDVSMDWSFKFFTRDEWRTRYGSKLSKIRLDAHDGNLLVWFEDGTPGFLMRFDMEDPSMTRLSDPIYASFVYPLGDALYLSNGNGIFEFKGSNTRKPFVWWSKDFIAQKPLNYGAIQLVGTGSVTVEVFADGVTKHTTAVTLNDTGSTVIRLPSGFLARRWSFKLTGAADTFIYEKNVAVSPTEFASV